MEQQPKPQLDAGVVYRLLPLTVSHDDAQRKPAEQQLLAYESVPGFASLLLVLPPPQNPHFLPISQFSDYFLLAQYFEVFFVALRGGVCIF